MNEIRYKIFFFHCPKAGGTSIQAALTRATPQASASPPIENDMVGHTAHSNWEGFRGYDIYCGHYGKDIFDAVSDGHLAITNFRHPVSRIASLYNYFRYDAVLPEQSAEDGFHAVRFAKDNDFRSFVTCCDPRVAVYTRNQHVRQLSRSPWENTPGSLRRARDLVTTMPWYYVCEYPDLSQIWLRDALGLGPIGYENKTTKGDEAIDPAELETDLVEKICLYNVDDLALYCFAVGRLLSRQSLRRQSPIGLDSSQIEP